MFVMQINMGSEEEPDWKSISQKGSPPYTYETREEAERMLGICYPDLMREDRLDGKRIRTRVIETEKESG